MEQTEEKQERKPKFPIGFAMLLAVLIVLCIALMFILAPFLIYSTAISLVLLQAIGLVYLAMRVWKWFNKIEIKDIPERGTIIRLPNGKLQIVSPIEVFAFETKEDIIVNMEQWKRDQQQPLELVPPFTEAFTEDNTHYSVSQMETPMETEASAAYVEPVMTMLETEEQQAKRSLEQKQREVLKQRILTLKKNGFPLRIISKIVHMDGRKYKQFQELCTELELPVDQW